MKRRDFFQKSGGGVFGLMLAHFGLTSCKKTEEAGEEAAQQAEEHVHDQAGEHVPEAAEKCADQVEHVKKLLMEKKGLTEEEAAAQIAEFKKTLPAIQEKCICKTCPTFVAEETVISFCHPLIGKSKVITEEKGCDCPKCPIYAELKLKNGYYCTRDSELVQEMAKTG